MADCAVCGVILDKDDATVLKCSGGCEKQAHQQCVLLDGVKTRAGVKEWKCEDCSVSKNPSAVSTSKSLSSAITKEFFLSTLEAFKKEVFVELKNQGVKVTEFNASVQFLSDSVDASNVLMEKVRADYAEIKKENDLLKKQNNELMDTVYDLKDRVRNLEQYSRRTNIEISGIPETPKEDAIQLLRDVGTAIGQELNEEQVMAAHRIPSYSKTRTPSLVVQFQTRMQRDSWISAFKKKQSLKAKDVNPRFKDTKVYINEHLSPDNKYFLSQLKLECKDLNIKYVWCKDGKFYVRKKDGDKCFKINRFDDLKNVK